MNNLRDQIADSASSVARRRLGFEMDTSWLRGLARTLLDESGLRHPDAIEQALAHGEKDRPRAAYHRGAHWDVPINAAFPPLLRGRRTASARRAADRTPGTRANSCAASSDAAIETRIVEPFAQHARSDAGGIGTARIDQESDSSGTIAEGLNSNAERLALPRPNRRRC